MKDKHIQDLFDRALEAGRNRDYHQAIELLQEILVQSDQMPIALLYLGRAYHAAGDINRAIQVLQFFLKLQPDSAAGHFFLGRAYFTLGLVDHAFGHLEKSTSLDGSFVPALGLLGLTLLKHGRPQESIAVFEKALALEPDNRSIFTGYLNAPLRGSPGFPPVHPQTSPRQPGRSSLSCQYLSRTWGCRSIPLPL